MSGVYAKGTKVTVASSQAEIQRTLERYGAQAFGFGQDLDQARAVVTFRAHGRHIRFDLPLPRPDDREITHRKSSAGWLTVRSETEARNVYDAEVRRRWRALAMAIKALLEVVETGIATFEQALLPFTVLPTGETVGAWLEPQVQHAYEHGTMPALLPGGQPQLDP